MWICNLLLKRQFGVAPKSIFYCFFYSSFAIRSNLHKGNSRRTGRNTQQRPSKGPLPVCGRCTSKPQTCRRLLCIFESTHLILDRWQRTHVTANKALCIHKCVLATRSRVQAQTCYHMQMIRAVVSKVQTSTSHTHTQQTHRLQGNVFLRFCQLFCLHLSRKTSGTEKLTLKTR